MILGMPPTAAQLTTATVSGTVADSTGAIIPGVSVSVFQVETEATRSVVTDDQGRYHVPSLQPGTYEVSAELPGFQTAVRSGLQLAVGDRTVVNLTLTVGERAGGGGSRGGLGGHHQYHHGRPGG